MAVLLNINKWLYFSMRIMAKVKINDFEDKAHRLAQEEEMSAENTVIQNVTP